MNTLELVYKWADLSCGMMTNKQRNDELHGLCRTIARALKDGESVPLLNIGKLKVKEIPERTGRNPKTGEAIVIPAKKKVVLTMNKAFRDFLNE